MVGAMSLSVGEFLGDITVLSYVAVGLCIAYGVLTVYSLILVQKAEAEKRTLRQQSPEEYLQRKGFNDLKEVMDELERMNTFQMSFEKTHGLKTEGQDEAVEADGQSNLTLSQRDFWNDILDFVDELQRIIDKYNAQTLVKDAAEKKSKEPATAEELIASVALEMQPVESTAAAADDLI